MPAWKRLITCPLTIDERIPLITTIFSDRGEIEAASSLRGNDAQSFIDAIDQVPLHALTRDSPLTLTSSFASRWLGI